MAKMVATVRIWYDLDETEITGVVTESDIREEEHILYGVVKKAITDERLESFELEVTVETL